MYATSFRHDLVIRVVATAALATPTIHASDTEQQQLTQLLGTGNYSVFTVDPPSDTLVPWSFEAVVGSVTERIMLYPHSLRAPDFGVSQSDSNGLRTFEPNAPATYRGHIEGLTGSYVVAAIIDGQLSAQISTAENTWALHSVNRLNVSAAPGTYVVFSTDSLQRPPASCGLHSPDRPVHSAQLTLPAPAGDAHLDVLVAEIACDADVEFFIQNNSSIDNTVADIESIINAVSAIYERDLQVQFLISEIIIRTEEPDPYASTNPDLILDEFRTHWINNHNDVHRDVAHLFTGKDIDGTIVGSAWRGALCDALSFSVAQSRFDPDSAMRAAVSAHEIGHNFDSGHCDDSDWWCRIMCSGIGGCSGFHSFSPWALDFMRAFADESGCLEPGIITQSSMDLPFYDDFDYSGEPDAELWEAVDGVFNSTVGGVEPSPTRSAQLNEYDTMRTVVVSATGPTSISFWANHRGVETGKRLRVEYFDSNALQWRILEDIISDGVSDSTFDHHKHDLPTDGYGEFLAVRFTPWGPFVDFSDKWYVDDVLIEASGIAGDCDGDGDVDLLDFACFVDCASGPGEPVLLECAVSDFDQDNDVDLVDFSQIQIVFSG